VIIIIVFGWLDDYYVLLLCCSWYKILTACFDEMRVWLRYDDDARHFGRDEGAVMMWKRRSTAAHF
jgi:hypothetical protein